MTDKPRNTKEIHKKQEKRKRSVKKQEKLNDKFQKSGSPYITPTSVFFKDLNFAEKWK